LAGGTDLVPQLKQKKVRPDILVDIGRVNELNRNSQTPDSLFLGTLTRISELAKDSCSTTNVRSLLTQAAKQLGSPQVRNRATLGGNVANASPAADMVAVLMALGSRVHIMDSHGNSKRIPIGDFFLGPGKTALREKEIITGFEIPISSNVWAGHFSKLAWRQGMDLAIVNCAIYMETSPKSTHCAIARIILGAVAPTPLNLKEAAFLEAVDLMAQQEVLRETENISDAVGRAISPISDQRGSAEYRRITAPTLVSRGIRATVAQLTARFKEK
jgi:carbon-monoxide dehydrogenase medium subunit